MPVDPVGLEGEGLTTKGLILVFLKIFLGFSLLEKMRRSQEALVANFDSPTTSLFIVWCFLNSNSNRKLKLNRQLSFNTIRKKMRVFL
jgi:hypothetical protein